MPLDVARRGTLDVRAPPLKAIVAANDNYEAGYHKGNAGGLDAIDTDLAAANIKEAVTIFGKLGTYAGAAPTLNTGIAFFENDAVGSHHTWFTKGTCEVPANAITVAVQGWIHESSDTEQKVRCTYNAVQKYLVEETYMCVEGQAVFAGIGSGATLNLDYNGEGFTSECAGVAYYTT